MITNLSGNISSESKKFFLMISFLSLVLVVCAILNMFWARAVVGFFYLSFIPGMVLIRLVRMHCLDPIKRIIFSIGFSIAFLMLFGLLINFVGPIFGVREPLSPTSLLIIIPLILETMALVSLFSGSEPSREGDKFVFSKENKIKIVLSLLFTSLPVFSVIGTFAVNVYGNNSVLLILIVFASGLVGVACVYPKLDSDKFYGFAICMLAIALLLHSSLISNYVYGGDIHMEYQLFSVTSNASFWNPTIRTTDLGYQWMNAMLSITILPTIYVNLLGIEGTWVFKVVFPIIFSIVCLGLYLLYRKEFEPRLALIAVFFFMANSVFFNDATVGNMRQMIAELFYILLFLTVLDEEVANRIKTLIFSLFAYALIVSHYSTSYLFLFMILGLWCYTFLMKKSRKVSEGKVVMFCAIMFSWYIYVSNSGPFRGLLSTIEWIRDSFVNQFLFIESRGPMVLQGLGLSGISTFWHSIGRGFFYLTEFLIIIGFVYLVLTRKKRVVSNEYFILVLFNMIILAACVIVPTFANTLNMTRFYHLTLFFLAPLLVIASLQISYIIARKLRIKTGIILAVLVLIPFFLFQTGFVYEITGEVNYSIPLSKDRMGLIPYVYMSMITQYDALGARWALENINYLNASFYSDLVSTRALASYGMVYTDVMQKLTNVTVVDPDGIVFLGWTNLVMEKVSYGATEYNTTALLDVLQPLNIIYSSGGCEIYNNPK